VLVRDTESMLQLGELIAKRLVPGDTVYLMGELGAGKTTLAQGIVRGLGYAGRVTSPTFALINVYQGRIPVYHCDFYRLEEKDFYDIGIEDYLEKEGIVLIEWPERLSRELPGRALLIKIDLVDDDYEGPRLVTITGKGKRYEGRVEELKTIVSVGFGNCDPGSGGCPDQ